MVKIAFQPRLLISKRTEIKYDRKNDFSITFVGEAVGYPGTRWKLKICYAASFYLPGGGYVHELQLQIFAVLRNFTYLLVVRRIEPRMGIRILKRHRRSNDGSFKDAGTTSMVFLKQMRNIYT